MPLHNYMTSTNKGQAMARVVLEFEEVTLTNDEGREVPGVCATCPECGESEESYGTGPRSRIRCLMLLKENCSESNYYVDPEADDGRPPDPVPKPWWEK
jgi:hypothetical protein